MLFWRFLSEKLIKHESNQICMEKLFPFTNDHSRFSIQLLPLSGLVSRSSSAEIVIFLWHAVFLFPLFVVWFNYRCPFCGFNNVKLFYASPSPALENSPLKGEQKKLRANRAPLVGKRQIESEAAERIEKMKFHAKRLFLCKPRTRLPPFIVKLFCCTWAKKSYTKVQKQHHRLIRKCNLNNLMYFLRYGK
jgi:hypothetical protein